jgi:type I restriction enzyme S subunit
MRVAVNTLSDFDETRTEIYRRTECATFRKTSEQWGEFSNMAGGFPIVVNGVKVLTSEALYQACRFPHLPEVQQEILRQASPMAAKMKGKPHRRNSRPDFDELRVVIMWWALRVKLACNLPRFSQVLLGSHVLPIVEDSHKDQFWGAKQAKNDTGLLVGQNVLGRLLVLLRDLIRRDGSEGFSCVEPPAISNFLLLGEPIGIVPGSV